MKSNLEAFYWQIAKGIDSPFAALDVISMAEETADIVSEFASGDVGMPSISTVEAGAKLARAGNNAKKIHQAQSTLVKDYWNASDENRDAASEIADVAFVQSNIVPYGKYWGDKVGVVKRAKIYSAILQTLDIGVSPSQLDNAIPVLTNTLTECLNSNVSHEHFLKKLWKEGGTRHISFKKGAMKHIFNALKEQVSGDQFKDSIVLDCDQNHDERYTAIESDEEEKTPGQLPHRPVRTNIEAHHDTTKARRYIETYKATVGTAKVAETVAVAAATHGVASPLVLEDVYKTGRAIRAVKKNYDAVRALSPSLNNATNEQIDAADEIIENAIKNCCLLTEDKKPWNERVDIVKKSKIYANVLEILINEVSPDKLKEAEPVVTELIVEHFNANIVYKHPSRNFMKEGGRKHLSFSDETTKNLYPEIAQALGEQFHTSVELEAEDSVSPKSRRHERKEQSRSSLPDHIRKEASSALSRAGSRSSSSFSERVQKTNTETKKDGFTIA